MSSKYKERIEEIFDEEFEKHNLKGLFGVARFESVYSELLPIQQKVLLELCGDRFSLFLDNGSFLSIAFVYPEYAIDVIATRRGASYNLEAWNRYAREYSRLNNALNATSNRIVEAIGGISIQATLPGLTKVVSDVEDYYGLTISHRVVAEKAGIGWRGKNELIVNPKYSCAIRLSSIMTEVPIEPSSSYQNDCGDCTACFDACTFLKNKERLTNYREQCRRYINSLGLENEVCGKCIKACLRESIYADKFSL